MGSKVNYLTTPLEAHMLSFLHLPNTPPVNLREYLESRSFLPFVKIPH
jgi:hypothetical protein